MSCLWVDNLTPDSNSEFRLTVPAVVVGVEDEEVDLVAGSQHIIPYQLISDLVLKGSVQLI